MTFSVVGRCAETGMLGMAVSSSSPAVAARCAHARADVGTVASQNITDPRLGTQVLDMLAMGLSPQAALDALAASRPHMGFRQILVVDNEGRSAVHNGGRALGLFGAVSGTNVACGGNLLASQDIPNVMMDAFSTSTGALGDRLMATMHRALAAGGEAGPIHSAGLKIVRDVDWPVVDLRVDWSDECPVMALDALWQRYKPELDDYITRALNPDAAPSYGVPGDE